MPDCYTIVTQMAVKLARQSCANVLDFPYRQIVVRGDLKIYMTEDETETRLVVLTCPAHVAEEVRMLSEFNAVDKTEFVVTAVELFMDYLRRQYPELAELPPAPLRTRTKHRAVYSAEDDEPVLIAAEDED